MMKASEHKFYQLTLYAFTSMLVWLSEMVTTEIVNKLNEIGNSGITIDQWTPIRVLQR